MPGGYRFEIGDNGIGFDMKHKDKIWELFSRLVKDEDYPGTGAGLSIVKKLVEKQGGKVWVESQPGQGSRFYVEIQN
jgi:signal transduction histidine kinase